MERPFRGRLRTVLAQSFERATQDPAAPDPPVDEALHELLRLHAKDDLDAAAALFAAIRAFSESPRGASAMLGERSASYRAVTELDALSEELPVRVRTAIAEALQNGDVSKAKDALRKVAGHDARLAEFLLRKQAPTLSAAVCDALDTRERWHESIDRWVHDFLGSRIVKIALAVVLVALGTKLWLTYRPVKKPPVDDALIRERVNFAAGKAREAGRRDLAILYEKIGEALLKQPPDCAAAHSNMHMLEQWAEGAPDDDRRATGALVGTVRDVMTKRCP